MLMPASSRLMRWRTVRPACLPTRLQPPRPKPRPHRSRFDLWLRNSPIAASTHCREPMKRLFVLDLLKPRGEVLQAVFSLIEIHPPENTVIRPQVHAFFRGFTFAAFNVGEVRCRLCGRITAELFSQRFRVEQKDLCQGGARTVIHNSKFVGIADREDR